MHLELQRDLDGVTTVAQARAAIDAFDRELARAQDAGARLLPSADVEPTELRDNVAILRNALLGERRLLEPMAGDSAVPPANWERIRRHMNRADSAASEIFAWLGERGFDVASIKAALSRAPAVASELYAGAKATGAGILEKHGWRGLVLAVLVIVVAWKVVT